MSYLFDGEAGLEDDADDRDEAKNDAPRESGKTDGEDSASDDARESSADASFGRKKKRKKGIDDEDPVSFRTATGKLTIQQILYYVVRDLFYAAGPMITYIVITILCIVVGYPLSGMMRFSFREYMVERSNLMVAIAVVLTLRRLHRRSRKGGSTFFEDAALFHKGVSWKKIVLAVVFGTGTALFLSAVLTLIPKVWVFATYQTQVSRIYQRYDILLTIVESAVLTPLVEEIIFRGYMLNRLLRRWQDLPALLVTTLIFSILHGSSIWILYAFVMGLLIGQLSLREGNILYGIFLHAGFNLPSVVQWFTWFLHPERQSEGRATDIFQTILTGVTGGIVAVLVALLYRRMTSDKERWDEVKE